MENYSTTVRVLKLFHCNVHSQLIQNSALNPGGGVKRAGANYLSGQAIGNTQNQMPAPLVRKSDTLLKQFRVVVLI